MSLSPQFLDEVRARTTLSTLIGKSIKVQKAGREYKACCPFHNEKTPSFTINDEKGFYHCFGCGEHGDAIRWMTEQRGLTFLDAVKELAEGAGLALPAPDPHAARRAEAAKTLHDVMAAAQAWFVEQLNGLEGAEARAYLDKRGMTAATVKDFGFGYAPDSRGKLKAALKEFDESLLVEAGMLIQPEAQPDGGDAKRKRESYDRFRGRLMIPIRDARGRVIAFGGRILGAGEPKYLNSPDTPLFDKGRTLYNLDKAAPAARKSDRMIVVEGYMDAIALSQAGFTDVVAPLGTALTENQIEKLWSMVETPTLCFDGDSAGQKAADRAMLRALPMLKPGHSLSIASLPVGVDPDDLLRLKGSAAFQIILDSAQPLADRLWTYEVAQGETDTPERRAGLKARLNERVGAIGDTLVKQEYSKQLQDKFFESFGWGWRKSEVNGVRRAINDTRVEAGDSRIDMRSRIERKTFRAVLLGVSRWPSLLYGHREQLQTLSLPTAHLARWRDILVSASYERPALEEDLIEAILASSDIQNLERRDLQNDLAFSFFFKSGDRETAEGDLKEVIQTLVVEQDLAARLAGLATEPYAPGLDDASYGRKLDEHHGLLRELAQYRERLSLLRADAEQGLAAA
ncbi:DNA primase [Sphingobium sufflavum]|uniref:DNA primase n=1 Tax=Sphingobium sufflavum TaxID=1129547 RepID=UPI001F29EB2F|nr:DNA primase [Sphingobium sufflavum]MCE7797436.1 DNA primase [Sphingobium sufflavum]